VVEAVMHVKGKNDKTVNLGKVIYCILSLQFNQTIHSNQGKAQIFLLYIKDNPLNFAR
jgi:hypothetical protein